MALRNSYRAKRHVTELPSSNLSGPPHYPLIGGALSMPSGDIHLTQQEWLAKYGGVVGIMMGPRPGLFIQGAPYVQDALKKPEFQGRPQTSDFTATSFGKSLGEFCFLSDRSRVPEMPELFPNFYERRRPGDTHVCLHMFRRYPTSSRTTTNVGDRGDTCLFTFSPIDTNFRDQLI
jgi:Cytochrome P450.